MSIAEVDRAIGRTYKRLESAVQGDPDGETIVRAWLTPSKEALRAYQDAFNHAELTGEALAPDPRPEATQALMATGQALYRALGAKYPSEIAKHFTAWVIGIDIYNEETQKLIRTPEDDYDFVLRPGSITNMATGEVTHTDEPIQDCLGANRWSSSGKNRPRMAEPGSMILVKAGEYKHFRVTHTYDEGDGFDDQTVLVFEEGSVVKPNPVGGSQTLYCEWTGGFSFRGLKILGDDTSSVQTENPYSKRWGGSHPGFRDIFFHDCTIDGGFDFSTNSGKDCKWGFQNYAVGPSKDPHGYGFIFKGGSVSGIKREHAFYEHNIQGNFLIEDTEIKWCGRTAIQVTARRSDGAAGQGDIVLRRVTVEDVCLEDGGGGSAFTFKGHQSGTILLDSCEVRLGCEPTLHETFQDNITGSLVLEPNTYTESGKTQDESKWDKCNRVIVRGCVFEVGKEFVGRGSARRSNVRLRWVKECTLEGTTIISHPGTREALEVDLQSIDQLTLGLGNQVAGRIIVYDPSGDKRTFESYDAFVDGVRGFDNVTVLEE